MKYKSLEERAAKRRAHARAPAREEEPEPELLRAPEPTSDKPSWMVFVNGTLLAPTQWRMAQGKLIIRRGSYPKDPHPKLTVYEIQGGPLALPKADVVFE